MKYIIKYFLLVILAVSSSIMVYNYMYIDKSLDGIDLEKAEKLMIIAHPDDETLWGGAHLLEDDYLVVCITCGGDKRRVQEFKKAMKISGDQYLMLGYPDKVFGVRSKWTEEEKRLKEDLKIIMQAKKWKLIVTHNFDGEYGHEQHIKANKFVMEVYNSCGLKSDLYLFGKYYTKGKIKKAQKYLEKIDKKYIEEKYRMINIYKSQDFIKTMFNQMFDYEEWVKYENTVAIQRMRDYEKTNKKRLF